MKLSEAIRKGSAETEQAFGSFFTSASWGDESRVRSACALGAALLADGFDPLNKCVTPTRIIGHFPLLKHRAKCPAEGCGVRIGHDLFSIIPHLNDDHQWSRRDIADWVETFEEDSIPVDVGVPAEKSADMALAPEEAPV